jgi:two-component system, chemotaxis family, protein-glutamate methylesterase/glutaminase
MRKYRVLVVDDSTVVRQILVKMLSVVPTMEVVGTAANGRLALEKLQTCRPDIVVLDLEMPEVGGMQFLDAIRHRPTRPRVLVFSSLTERGASVTLEALSRGADDYVPKPTTERAQTMSLADVSEILIRKLEALGTEIEEREDRLVAPERLRQPCKHVSTREPGTRSRIEIVAIGTSTGGPNALMEILPQLPEDFPVPMLVAQHMPATFTKMLATTLHRKTKIPVVEASDADVLCPAKVWIAPGGHHMVVKRTDSNLVQIRLNEDPPEEFCRPSVNVLFRSLAAVYGSRMLAVVLTGMGKDGLDGCHRIHDLGGQILAQDRASSVIWSMPTRVSDAGLADKVVPLNRVASEILSRVRMGRVSPVTGKSDDDLG